MKDLLFNTKTQKVKKGTKLMKKRLGFLINFNVVLIKEGIKRIIN
jgi:hypothetical protein